MINETLEADRAYKKDKNKAYERGYAHGKRLHMKKWIIVNEYYHGGDGSTRLTYVNTKKILAIWRVDNLTKIYFSFKSILRVKETPEEIMKLMGRGCVQGKVDAKPYWILCNERLPEENVDVLCQTFSGVRFVASYGLLNPWSTEKGWITSEFNRFSIEWIKAWMPLPESYKEETK